jgi:hypothetical protein
MPQTEKDGRDRHRPGDIESRKDPAGEEPLESAIEKARVDQFLTWSAQEPRPQ